MTKWVYQRGMGQSLVRDTLAADSEAGPRNPASQRNTVLTSGLFHVPQEPNQTLNVYAANPYEKELNIRLQVNRVVRSGGTGGKEAFIDEKLTLPAHEVVSFNVDAPAGEIIEVNAITTNTGGSENSGAIARPANEKLAEAAIVSATVTQFFPADAGITPHVTLAAGSFTRPNGRAAGQFSTGLIDLPQGVAAARPQAQLLLSNFVNWPLTTTLTVREREEHLAALQTKLRREIRVMAQGAAVVPLESVEGRTVQIDLALPTGLGASLDVHTLFLADNSTLPVFRLGPEDWMRVG